MLRRRVYSLEGRWEGKGRWEEREEGQEGPEPGRLRAAACSSPNNACWINFLLSLLIWYVCVSNKDANSTPEAASFAEDTSGILRGLCRVLVACLQRWSNDEPDYSVLSV